jgi:hypothetical protein
LNVGDTLYAISEAGLTLTASKTEDILQAYLANRLTQELAAALTEHKAGIIRIMREDEEFRRTGIIHCEHQAFELAREFFGLNEKEGGS